MAWAALGLALLSPEAHAHGLWGHIHVTGWAVENMPDDELRQFLLEPEVFNALLFGATFADTGYQPFGGDASRAYAEHAHWEPFVEDYVEWILVNDPPPWDSLASRKRVAFLLGCASHGLQDAIFDSLFLYQVEARDGAGQDVTDPGTDGFLVLDEHIRFFPEQDIPMSTVLELFTALPEEVTEEVISDSVAIVMGGYINDGVGLTVAAANGEKHADEMPWGRAHYLDAEVPGSLRAEIYPTLAYQQALWARLHGTFSPDEATIFAFPESPRRLRAGDAETTDSWVTLVFGAGLQYEGELTELVDADGAPVAFSQASNRWGEGWTRLIRLLPEEDLVPGAWYTARLRAGARLINGTETGEVYEVSFQVACDTAGDPACPELGDIPEASIDGIPEAADTGQDTGQAEPRSCGCAVSRRVPGGLLLPLPLLVWGVVRRVSRR